MKKIKYITLVILLISLSISSFPHILSGFSLQQSQELLFLETYTYAEFTSDLDSNDPFYKMINTADVHQGSAKLGSCPESKLTDLKTYLQSQDFLKHVPKDIRFAWGAEQGGSAKVLYALKETGPENYGPDQSEIKKIEIVEKNLLITFSDKGAEKWAALTEKNVGRDLAIVFNKLVYAAPKVKEAIMNGKCAISGNFSEGELIALKSVLEN